MQKKRLTGSLVEILGGRAGVQRKGKKKGDIKLFLKRKWGKKFSAEYATEYTGSMRNNREEI